MADKREQRGMPRQSNAMVDVVRKLFGRSADLHVFLEDGVIYAGTMDTPILKYEGIDLSTLSKKERNKVLSAIRGHTHSNIGSAPKKNVDESKIHTLNLGSD